jgi:AcrR family transcriptional regulator
LYSAAFAHGAALTADWLEAQRRELASLPRSPAAGVFALERLITGWTAEARPLALLYQEQRAAAFGDAAWSQLWRGFWRQFASTFGHTEAEGRLLHDFFESEALYHLSTWSPALEQAALRELCETFGDVWLGAGRREPLGALATAEALAGARPAWALSPMEGKIAEAAAAVVEKHGLGALTHRAVAAQAGVTTGAVTHYFRTVEALVTGAIRGQVLAISADRNPLALVDGVDTIEGFVEVVRRDATGDPPLDLNLRRRLFLASLRRPDLVGAGAVIRYAQGATTRELLTALSTNLPEPQRPLELSLTAAVFSRLMSSLWLPGASDGETQAARAAHGGLIAERLGEALTRQD